MEKPIQGFDATPLVISDNFDTDKLALNWQWNHNPDNNLWSLSERPGYMRLKTGKVVETIFEARNILSQRTEGPKCSGIISMDISNMKDGCLLYTSVLQGLQQQAIKYLVRQMLIV